MMGRARIRRLRRRANPSPSSSSAISAGAMMIAVFHTEAQNRASWKSASA